jgi:8-oxo-dGTP pyrophosphatase MutT (NUDIX family)
MLNLIQREGTALASAFDLESLKRRLQRQSQISKPVGSQPEAAVAIIINRSGSILLIKRTEREGDPWSGQIAFPGGHKAPNDRDFLETAIREAREEVGIDLHDHELLGQLPLVYARSRGILVISWVFRLVRDVIVRSNEEVAASFWVPLSVLAIREASKSMVTVDDSKLIVDAYVYDGNIVWGLTFRIINVLLDRKDVAG